MVNKEDIRRMIQRIQTGMPNNKRFLTVGNSQIAWKNKEEIQKLVHTMVDLLGHYMSQEEAKKDAQPVQTAENA